MCKAILTILAFFVPPWAVLFHKGCTCDLCINVLLTSLCCIPGIIHAWCVIWREEPTVSVHTSVYVQGQPTVVNCPLNDTPSECPV